MRSVSARGGGQEGVCADYNQPLTDYGLLVVDDEPVTFTATPPGRVVDGHNDYSLGITWVGGPQAWTSTQIGAGGFAGIHNGRFSGHYVPEGPGYGPTKLYTWQADTKGVIVKAEISGTIDRIPPNKTKKVTVIVTPSPMPSGSITLKCEADPGTSGSASVSPGAINQTTEVTVTGGTQSGLAEKDHIKLKAICKGKVLAEEAFTVCAHPIDFVNDGYDILLNQYGFRVFFSWKSDSDSVGDLNVCSFREYVFETRKVSPPFYGSFLAQNRSFTMQTGAGQDDISTPADCINNYCDGYWIHDQTYRWQCGCCGYLNDAAVGMAGCHVFNYSATNVDWVIRTTYTTLGVVMVIQDLLDEP